MRSSLVAETPEASPEIADESSEKNEQKISLILIGASYKTAPLAYREKLARLLARDSSPLRRIANSKEYAELVTCNRVEVAMLTDSFSEEKVSEWLAEKLSGMKENFVYFRKDSAAIAHLFRVASGLDSMVLGEEQILTQVKEAGIKARRSRSSRSGLSALFDASVGAGRRVRAAVRPANQSVSSMALEFALRRLPGPPRNVLLIGTGKTSRLAATQLGKAKLYVATRRSSLSSFSRATKVGHARLKSVARNCDLIIAATKHHGYVLRDGDLPRDGNHVVLDLAFPRNIDPKLRSGSVEVFDLDDLAKIFGLGAASSAKGKLAEELVAAEAEAFSRWFLASRQSSALSTIYRWAEQTRQKETHAALRRLSQLSERDKRIVESLSRRLVSKLLAPPTAFAKSSSSDFPQGQRLEAIERVFERRDGEA